MYFNKSFPAGKVESKPYVPKGAEVGKAGESAEDDSKAGKNAQGDSTFGEFVPNVDIHDNWLRRWIMPQYYCNVMYSVFLKKCLSICDWVIA